MNSCPACASCKFFRLNATDPARGGECRLRAPVIVDDAKGGLRVFPRVYREDWCGEWQQKITPLNKLPKGSVPLLEEHT